MYKSKPEFKRIPQVQQYYDFSRRNRCSKSEEGIRRYEAKNRRSGKQS